VEVIEQEAAEDAPRPADMWGDGVEGPAQQLEQPPEATAPVPPGWGDPEPLADGLEVEQLEQHPDVAEALPVVIEPPAQGPAEVPPIEPEPQQLEHPDPVEVAADVPEALDQPDALEVEHTTPEPDALPQSQLPEALQDAPADPAPQVVELEQHDREAGEQFGKGTKVSPDLGEAMPAGWCDAVELAAAAGLGGVTAITSAKRKGRLVEGIHWRKAPPGLKLPGARKPLRLIWNLAACLEVLGTATASERISAEQLRAKVRETIREQGRRRRERRSWRPRPSPSSRPRARPWRWNSSSPPNPNHRQHRQHPRPWR
jgi:hypothetical protein